MLKKIFAFIMSAALLSGISFAGINIVTYAVETEEQLNIEEQVTAGNKAEDTAVPTPATLDGEEHVLTTSTVRPAVSDLEDLERPLVLGMESMISAIDEKEAETEAEAAKAAQISDECDNMIIAYVDPYLNVRDQGSEAGKVVGIMRPGTVAVVLEKGDSWSYIESGEVRGYIKNSFINFADSPAVIRSIGVSRCPVAEPIIAEPETEAETETQAETQEQVQVQAAAPAETETEEVKAPESEEPAESAAASDETGSEDACVPLSQMPTYGCSATEDEVYLLACLVYCEAGNQSLDGQRAVANVVVNRVNDSRFPSTITDVIYQPGQFRPQNDYVLNSVMREGPPESCINAAREAISGVNTLGNYMFYATSVNINKYTDYKTLEDHTFYNRF